MTESAAEALLRQQVSDEQFAFLHALLADPDLSITNAAAACSLDVSVAKRWMRTDRVRRVLGELLRERQERHADVRSSVVLMLWRMACADPRRAFSDTGEQLAPHELPDEIAACIESIKPVHHEGVVVGWHYTFAKRVSILDLLLKHFDAPKQAETANDASRATVIFRGVVNAAPSEEE